MAEHGAGLGTSYPAGIDTNTSLETSSTKARAAVPNDLSSAIIAVQAELGTNPRGTAADVKTRIGQEHNADGTHPALVHTLASYTTAGLPAAGTAGRIARVTDGIRGIWKDTGTAWVSVTGYADARDWGVSGDGTGDQYAAIQAWINDIPTGGKGYLPRAAVYYRVLDTPTISRPMHIFGDGIKLMGGALLGSIIRQEGGTTKDALHLDGATNGEIDGLLLENLILGGTSASRYGLRISGTSPQGLNRSLIRNIIIPGAGTAGLRTESGTLVVLNHFDHVRIVVMTALGYANPLYGYHLGAPTGPNTWTNCGVSGVTTAPGYGWYLDGANTNTFISPQSEGNGYGWFFAGAAAGNIFIAPYHEASVTAPVGGSTTNKSNLVFGSTLGASTTLDLETAGLGAVVNSGGAGTGNTALTSRSPFLAGSLLSPFTTAPLGALHASKTGVTAEFNADVDGGGPIFGHTDSNVADVLLAQLVATGALADARLSIGANGSQNVGDIGMRAYKRSTGVQRNININKLGIDVIATASLPAAAAQENGRVVIEDAGAGDRNLVIYAGGQRFRIDGGANF